MKFNKYMAFTLAELMVMLSVLTVLLAAFAPIFTVRYNNASAENVWSFVTSDDNNDAYMDPINKLLTAQSFIGMQPAGKTDVASSVSYNSNVLYSKLVIRASNRLTGGEKQKQMRFLYGNDSKKGKDVGALFAGNGNMLLGGLYSEITDSAQYNTAFGSGALSAIKSGSFNTAAGYAAGTKVVSSSHNTLIGYNAGTSLTTGNKNTLVGYNVATKLSTGGYNTVVGNNSGFTTNNTYYNTLVGDYIGYKASAGYANTAVGYAALSGTSIGQGNTAIGAYALSKSGVTQMNTAIGYNACAQISGSYKTCIGSNVASKNTGMSGAPSTISGQDWLYTDSNERIYIGSAPYYNTSVKAAQRFGGVSVLEVHNVSGQSSDPSNMGNSSVLINGNLIVRGQPFFTGDSPFYGDRALVGFYIKRPKGGTKQHAFMGFDGNNLTHRVQGRHNVRHAKYGGRENCTCAHKCTTAANGYTSYDWATRASGGGDPNEDGGIRWYWRGSFTDKSTGQSCKTNTTDHENEKIDLNNAHRADNGTCCPDLRSDIRLKNITDIFAGGLSELNRINVYNFTFKSDKNKVPQVGVIAQDLKKVFPASVSKDEAGYYQIRWDEMLYSAINAIKEINDKVVTLASKVSNERARIVALKRDNSQLEKQITSLANELSALEAKQHQNK